MLNETERRWSSAAAQPLLHLAWRQPVFGRDDGYKFHLYGGKNFAIDISLTALKLKFGQVRS